MTIAWDGAPVGLEDILGPLLGILLGISDGRALGRGDMLGAFVGRSLGARVILPRGGGWLEVGK